MKKKVGEVLYNVVRYLLLYILFFVVLFIGWGCLAGFSLNYTDVIWVICFFSLLGTYIPKIEKISLIILLISFCMYFILKR